MISVRNLFKKFDAILASVPISDNRNYYKQWKHSKIFNMDLGNIPSDRKLIKILKFYDDTNLQLKAHLNALATEVSKLGLSEISKKDIKWLNNHCHIFGFVSISDYCSENGYDKNDFRQEVRMKYCYDCFDKILEYLDKLLAKDENTKKKILENITEIFDPFNFPGYPSKLEYNIEEAIAYDIKITESDYEKYKEAIEAWKSKHSKPQQVNISKIYEDWFRSLGTKYRYVIPELSIEGNNLVDKFNFYIMDAAAEYMRLTKREEEFSAINNWIDKHPPIINGNIWQSSVLRNLRFDTKNCYFHKTPENMYKTKYYTYLSDTRRKERIGKYIKICLEKLEGSSTFKENARILEKIFNSHNIDTDNKLCVVLSRHEYDIVGQSTDRKQWDSCQNIYHGTRKGYITTTIDRGALIAYLCNVDDTEVKMSNGENPTYAKGRKINIQNPLGRVLIKPFVKKGEVQDFSDPNWILMVSKVYGVFYEDLTVRLQSWLDKKWNNHIIQKNGYRSPYTMPEGLYRDLPRENAYSTITM